MPSLLIINIRLLVNVREENQLLKGKELSILPCIENAYMVIEDGMIAGYGEMSKIQNSTLIPVSPQPARITRSGKLRRTSTQHKIDASNQYILPCWCDSHTHLVFSDSRENEFVNKIKGMSYAEIAAKGGGILNSSKQLNETSEDELFNQAWKRLQEVSRLGTGAIEIKSGYGLSLEGELKMLRVIKKLKQNSNLSIKSTFLGAHTYPSEYKTNHQGYIDIIINEMLPVIAKEKLADFIDVYCETGFFSPSETETICNAGKSYGLKPKLHVNQLNSIGGIEVGLGLNSLSLDHLETLTEQDIQQLSLSSKEKTGVCTLLPTAAFFLGMPPQPARKLIDAGCAVAIASDYNPGTSPSGNMNLVVAMSCIQMKMLPEEAINAATINGAYAMDLQNDTGSITVGKKANLIFTKPIPSLAYLPYSFGTNLIDKVMINGDWVSRESGVVSRES